MTSLELLRKKCVERGMSTQAFEGKNIQVLLTVMAENSVMCDDIYKETLEKKLAKLDESIEKMKTERETYYKSWKKNDELSREYFKEKYEYEEKIKALASIKEAESHLVDKQAEFMRELEELSSLESRDRLRLATFYELKFGNKLENTYQRDHYLQWIGAILSGVPAKGILDAEHKDKEQKNGNTQQS